MLTTGAASRLCSVKRDTVLKWIKKGELKAVRTAGGHYRLEERDLSPFLSRSHAITSLVLPKGGAPSRSLRCWEYLCDHGAVREACRRCIAYAAHAAWCFRLAEKGREIGHEMQFCQNSCEDCAYYRRVNGLPTNVLVITSDQKLIEQLTAEEDETLTLCFARSAYQASAIISGFPPAFVVVDEGTTKAEESGLVHCLASDPRMPALKIILALRPGEARHRKHKPSDEVVAVMEKPFGSRAIASVVESFPVESLVPAGG